MRNVIFTIVSVGLLAGCTANKGPVLPLGPTVDAVRLTADDSRIEERNLSDHPTPAAVEEEIVEVPNEGNVL